MYRKTDPLDAARCLDIAINHYTAKGNFRRAATHKQNLAECYEVEIGDQKKAIESYELAASWFESDNAEAYVHAKDNQLLTSNWVLGWQTNSTLKSVILPPSMAITTKRSRISRRSPRRPSPIT